MKKFISWNVNGLRAVKEKGFEDIFKSLDADIFSLQETKLQAGQIELDTKGYFETWNYAEKKGYSGTAAFSKEKPKNVTLGMGIEELDTEGRLITLEFDKFYYLTCYTPNAQPELVRLPFRMQWEDAIRKYMMDLDKKKPIILCGDLNVARNEIDLKNPKSNIGNPGFSYEERGKMAELLDNGFLDSFRELYPDTVKYSWWSYRSKAREKNVGWRIDYYIVSNRLKDKIKDAKILNEIYGSDHCPVELDIDI